MNTSKAIAVVIGLLIFPACLPAIILWLFGADLLHRGWALGASVTIGSVWIGVVLIEAFWRK